MRKNGRRLVGIAIMLAVLLACAGHVNSNNSGSDPVRVMFIGNSHTFYNDMAQIFKTVAEEAGKNVEVTTFVHSGQTYAWHLSQLREIRFALLYGDFDYLVMQQAAHSPSPSHDDTWDNGTRIIALAQQAGVEALPVLPWAERRDPAHQAEMDYIYSELQDRTGTDLVNVGGIFTRINDKYDFKDLNLFWVDGEHCSPYGSYAFAMAVYTTIFKESPVGLAPKSFTTNIMDEADWIDVTEMNIAYWEYVFGEVEKMQPRAETEVLNEPNQVWLNNIATVRATTAAQAKWNDYRNASSAALQDAVTTAVSHPVDLDPDYARAIQEFAWEAYQELGAAN